MNFGITEVATPASFDPVFGHRDRSLLIARMGWETTCRRGVSLRKLKVRVGSCADLQHTIFSLLERPDCPHQAAFTELRC